jgi:hypothetical protein
VSVNLACLAAFEFVRTKNEALWLFLNSGVLQAMGLLGSYNNSSMWQRTDNAQEI